MTTTTNEAFYRRIMCALLNCVPDASPQEVAQIVAVMHEINEVRGTADE